MLLDTNTLRRHHQTTQSRPTCARTMAEAHGNVAGVASVEDAEEAMRAGAVGS